MTASRGRRSGRRFHNLAIPTIAALIVLTLSVLFYYPLATVFIEAIVVNGQLTLQVVIDVLRDPFYFGDPARILTGEPPGTVMRDFLSSDRQLGIIGFTAYQALLSTIASVLLGVPAAYILARFEFWGRRTIRSLTILPFVLPSIMVAVGFVAVFGQQGTLNATLTAVGLPRTSLLYSLEAIVIAHAFYNAPLVARITTAAWESVDAGTVETARSLGASRRRAFLDIIAPQLYPAIFMGAALTFVFTFGTFPIVLALGGFQLATVEVFIYRLVQDLQYSEAAVLAIIELLITLGVLFAYLQFEARYTVQSSGINPLPRHRLLPRQWTAGRLVHRLALSGYIAIAFVIFIAPIASMILESLTGATGQLTFDHYRFLIERQQTAAAFQVQPWPAIRNSLLFAVGTLLVALPMGLGIAILTTRRYTGRTVVGTIAMVPLAVSGIIVGIGLLRGLVFGIQIGSFRLVVTGSVVIIMAHAIAAYPFVVRTVAPGLDALDPSLSEAAQSLGASRLDVLRDIELPMVWPGVVAGAAFVVAISIGEFSSTVILATGTDVYTIPVAIERFIGRRLGPATAMGVVLLFVTSISFVIIDRLGGESYGL